VHSVPLSTRKNTTLTTRTLGNPKLVEALERALNVATAEVDTLDQKLKEVEREVIYFGEADANDIPAFFNTWLKFVQSIQKAVQYLQVQKKREEDKKREATQSIADKKKSVRASVRADKGTAAFRHSQLAST
jgi:NADH:ubiquinone oxidoreductase subunit